jgi:hypothetical protein
LLEVRRIVGVDPLRPSSIVFEQHTNITEIHERGLSKQTRLAMSTPQFGCEFSISGNHPQAHEPAVRSGNRRAIAHDQLTG